MTKETMPKIIEIDGVKYQRLEEPETPTLYEYLEEWSRGYQFSPYLNHYDVYNLVDQFTDYLYEYCEYVEEDAEKLVVSIPQKLLVCPSSCLEDSND